MIDNKKIPWQESIPRNSHALLQLLVSIVVVIHDDILGIEQDVREIADVISNLAVDYEIVIVDNSLREDSQDALRKLTSQGGEPNLQIYTLEGQVNDLTARWVGIENSLGDIVVCIEPRNGDIAQIERLIRAAEDNQDLVFTRRIFRHGRRNIPRTYLYRTFGAITRISTGIDLDSYSMSLLVLSRRVVSYLLQFPDPQVRFRNLPSSTGFRRTCLTIPRSSTVPRIISLRESLQRGIRLITASSDVPLRMATTLSALGALGSFAYSIYILIVWLNKKQIAPGWVSLSMQQAIMFFLISLVLLILSEYVLEISRKANSGPSYYIAQEFTSAQLTRKERLNVERDGLQQ